MESMKTHNIEHGTSAINIIKNVQFSHIRGTYNEHRININKESGWLSIKMRYRLFSRNECL